MAQSGVPVDPRELEVRSQFLSFVELPPPGDNAIIGYVLEGLRFERPQQQDTDVPIISLGVAISHVHQQLSVQVRRCTFRTASFIVRNASAVASITVTESIFADGAVLEMVSCRFPPMMDIIPRISIQSTTFNRARWTVNDSQVTGDFLGGCGGCCGGCPVSMAEAPSTAHATK